MTIRIRHTAICVAVISILALMCPISGIAQTEDADNIAYELDSNSKVFVNRMPADEAVLLFAVQQEGIPCDQNVVAPYACNAKANATVRAYKVSREGRSYIDLFVGLSAPLGTCVRIKGITDGYYRGEDLTAGNNYFRTPFSGSQIVPSGAFNLYVEGGIAINPSHSYDVSWHFKSWLLNGIDSYYNGSKTIFS